MTASLYIEFSLVAVGLLATARFMTERQMREESRTLSDTATVADTAGASWA